MKHTVDATKVRFGSDTALSLLDGIDTLIVSKGKRLERFNLKKARLDDEALIAKLLGPTGNLRAPTARIGRTLVVGFNEELYSEALG